ncbi:MAG: AsmA family protein [bacterium]|nr:AsmA family protein [bacterium]
MRRAFLIAATLVVAIITVLVVLPSFIDLNRYRGQVAAVIEKTLHRKVTVGAIRLGLLGGPRLRLDDVTIADRAEAGGKPAVVAKGLDIRLRLIPLLSRRIVVAKLTIREPTIHLTIAKDGSTNFSDLVSTTPPARTKAPLLMPGESQPPPKAPAPAAGPQRPASDMSITRLDIEDATFTVTDHYTTGGATLTHRLEDLDIRLRDVSLTSPIGFDVAGTVVRKTRQPFRLKGTMGPIGATPSAARLPVTVSVRTTGLDLAPLQPYVGDLLPITILAGSVTSDITLTRKIPEKLAAKGTLRFEAMDFTQTATGYRPPKPLTLDVDLSIQVDLAADTIKAERLRLTIGGSTVTASGTVAKARTAPELDVHVTSGGAALEDFTQLDPYLPNRLPRGLKLSGPVALDVAFKGTLSSFTARGSVDAKRSSLAWKELVSKGSGVPAALRFDASYDGEHLTLRETHLDLFTLTLDASGRVTNLARPTVDLKLSTNTVSLASWERFVPALKEHPLKGEVSFSGEVVGSISDPTKSRLDGKLIVSNVGPIEEIFTLAPALKASWPSDLALAGTATAEVTFRGSMQAFDIDVKADLTEGDFRYGELMKKPRGERASLTVRGRYRGDDVTIERIALSIKDLEVTGRGSITNLEDPVIDLDLTTSRVDLARWAPAGTRLTGKVSLAVGAKGHLLKPERLDFTQAKITASGIGPLDTLLKTLPSIRAALPDGFRMSGQADVSISFSGTYPYLAGRAVVDLTKAGLVHPGWIVKPTGQPARLAVEGRYTADAFVLKNFEVILGKDWIRGAAQVVDLNQPRGSISLASSPIRIERLAETLPVLKRYDLAGSISVDVHIKGDTAKLKEAQAKGTVDVRGLRARLPQLAAPLEKMTATLELKGQEAVLRRFTMSYGDSVLSLAATVRGFDAPDISFALDAPSLVLHQWTIPKKPRALKRPPKADHLSDPPSTPRILLVKATERANGGLLAWFKRINARGDVRARRVVYKEWLLDNLQAKTSLRRGVFILNHLTFGLHGGRYDGSAVVDLDPASAGFSLQSSLVGVDVNNLLSAHAQLPNTLWGRLQATLDIKGRGHTAETLMPTLAGRGQVTVTDGHINMALARDLLNNMPVLKLVGLVPGFQKLNTCTTQYTRQETTPFKTLTLPVSINRGVAAVAPSTLVLDSQDIDVVTGPNPGFIDLPRQEIHLRNIRAVFSRELTDQCLGADAKQILADQYGRMTFPFTIDGSFRGGRFPKPRPDERFLLNAIQRAVAGKFLQKVFGGGSRQPAPQQPGQQPTQPSPQLPIPGNIEDLLKIIR